MVRIVSMDRTKASPLWSSLEGSQSDPSRVEGEVVELVEGLQGPQWLGSLVRITSII